MSLRQRTMPSEPRISHADNAMVQRCGAREVLLRSVFSTGGLPSTPRKSNMEPENWRFLEMFLLFSKGIQYFFFGPMLVFRGSNPTWVTQKKFASKNSNNLQRFLLGEMSSQMFNPKTQWKRRVL